MHHDALTGLPNRTLFLDRRWTLLAAAQRKESTAAVLFVDLDRFKQINDTLGHSAGDRLPQEIADRLSGCLRAQDTIARMGGDEFTLLLPDLDLPEDAAKVAQKLLAALKLPLTLEGQEPPSPPASASASSPTTAGARRPCSNTPTWRCTDKEQGGDGYRLYTEAMNATAFERPVLENHLRKAITLDEPDPPVPAAGRAFATGRVTGVEALVRWRHPDPGIVLPTKFIPLAEEMGLIVPIGEWVLREARRQAARWHTHPQNAGQPLRVSVNLSARQFGQHNLAQTVAAILAETGLDPGWLD